MPLKLIQLILRNLTRSKGRLIATVGGCMTGAFIITFFLAADGSLSRQLEATSGESNLIVTQQDRY